MTTAMTTAVVCTAILGALVFTLGFNVSRMRGVTAKAGGSQLPADPADRLFIAIRAHGNAAEYVPTMIVLFLLVGWRQPGAWTTALIVAATVARLAHAYGIVSSKTMAAESAARKAGAMGTYAFGFALAVVALVTVF
jgi:uncharacterized membrane protein YecN with MAPEG domain